MINKMVQIGIEVLQRPRDIGVPADEGRWAACDGAAGKGIMKNDVQHKASRVSGRLRLGKSSKVYE